MGASALMSLGTRAMAANYAALQTTGNNIANANTAGYSRQSVELETAGGQFTGAGFFGKGVDVATVDARAQRVPHPRGRRPRAPSPRPTRRAARSCSSSRRSSARARPGIGYAAGQFFNAFVDVASQPQDASSRQVVLAARRRTGGALPHRRPNRSTASRPASPQDLKTPDRVGQHAAGADGRR